MCGQDDAADYCRVVKTGSAQDQAVPNGIVEGKPAAMMDAGAYRIEHPSRHKKDQDWSIEGDYQGLHEDDNGPAHDQIDCG